jgi:glycosyltransferase involved in cell wall biosynthesis
MATYNGARFIEDQLESIARQTRPPDELVVSDDGSTDATEDIIRRFAKDAPFPVHFRKNENRLGFGENFIQTALRCSGKWIAFCDQDDVWLPKKLELCLQEIDRGPTDLMLVAHNATITDARLHAVGALYRYPARKVTPALGLPPEWYCIGATQVFRADLLTAIPCTRRVSFPWHSHRDAHDVWVALISNCLGSILRMNEQLVLYRRHPTTVTDQGVGKRPSFELIGTGYKDRAAYLQQVVTTLQACASSVPADLSPALEQASSRMIEHAQSLRLRFRAYSAPKLGDRLATLARLVRNGAYLSSSPWAFGGMRLVKDSLCALRII